MDRLLNIISYCLQNEQSMLEESRLKVHNTLSIIYFCDLMIMYFKLLLAPFYSDPLQRRGESL